MDQDFIKLTSDGKELVINIRQIVRIEAEGGRWRIILTDRHSVNVEREEAERLFARLPGLPKTAGTG